MEDGFKNKSSNLNENKVAHLLTHSRILQSTTLCSTIPHAQSLTAPKKLLYHLVVVLEGYTFSPRLCCGIVKEPNFLCWNTKVNQI